MIKTLYAKFNFVDSHVDRIKMSVENFVKLREREAKLAMLKELEPYIKKHMRYVYVKVKFRRLSDVDNAHEFETLDQRNDEEMIKRGFIYDRTEVILQLRVEEV